MGVCFYDIYDFHMPAAYISAGKIEPMVALGPGFGAEAFGTLARLGVKLLEASVQPHENYGKRLTLSDIAVYEKICAGFAGRVVVPTQKAIQPEELPHLHDAGVRGIMIGAIVTGSTADSIEKATADFRAAADKM